MMRTLFAVPVALFLSGCGTTPAPKEAPKAQEAPKPITGRSAFYKMYPSARQWATDAQGIQLTSLQMTGIKAEPGLGSCWRGVFVSASKGRAKTFVWAADDAEGGFRKGVWPLGEESFSGKIGQAVPFLPQALSHDSDAAYKEAITQEDKYLKTNPKDEINIVLELTSRFPNPTWRVLWGETAGTAKYSVYVDASTGKFLEKGR